ncbi:MAG: aquaporin [Gemmobacter sp.]|uniref:aquaporin n=1 Tax=Gemmobacter sp. TaxID=1898957 RepID=UPI001A5A54D0|nr:aquaporin [Gemmobacter sp.]MBL8563348.1 aquaporin [Gemmobacter sp.]
MTLRLRPILAEALGTAALTATVIGSGIMADTLSPDDGVALLGNTLATAAMLYLLITTLGPVSGAQFNPVVSLVCLLRHHLTLPLFGAYLLAQIAGGLSGVALAHAMFDLPLWQHGLTPRHGPGQWLSEGVASFGLIATILAGQSTRGNTAALVAAYIAAAYWFTASTSFANPAVTLARAFTGTFSGIRLADTPAFALAQIAGALLAAFLLPWLLERPRQ